MPRHDDRHGNTRLYVGRLSSRTRTRDLESLFSRYGRVRDVDMKNDYAFVDFSDSRDADDARYNLDRWEFNGSRIIVEFAKGAPRGSREYLGKGPPGSGRCFNCGIDGHWARDCKDGDWKNKCYRCGERGHIERKCTNDPKKLSRGRSDSRSPVRSRSPRHRRNRSPSYSRSRSRSYSRSRSPVKRERSSRSRSPVKRERSFDRQRSSYSPRKRRSEAKSSPLKDSKRSPNDNEGSRSPLATREHECSDVRDSSPEKDSPSARRYRSPSEGNAPSPSLRDDRRSLAGNENGNSRSPRGSESP